MPLRWWLACLYVGNLARVRAGDTPCSTDSDAAIFLFPSASEDGIRGDQLAFAECPAQRARRVCSSTPEIFAQMSDRPWPRAPYVASKPVYAFEYTDRELFLVANEGWEGMFVSPVTRTLLSPLTPTHYFWRTGGHFWTGMMGNASTAASLRHTCSSSNATYFDSNSTRARAIVGHGASVSPSWFNETSFSCSMEMGYLCIVSVSTRQQQKYARKRSTDANMAPCDRDASARDLRRARDQRPCLQAARLLTLSSRSLQSSC